MLLNCKPNAVKPRKLFKLLIIQLFVFTVIKLRILHFKKYLKQMLSFILWHYNLNNNSSRIDLHSHRIAGGNATGGSEFTVETVFQVNLCLTNQVICADQIPVIHRHRQHRLHGKGGLDVK